MSLPVIVLSGFLGAGKTSLLRHLLPLCGEVGLRPALVINEVGDVDIDGQLLADLHAEQTRLVGGCVCCTLQSQLATTIDGLVEEVVSDVILIECSGMSNPLDVVSVLSMPGLIRKIAVSHVVCVLDAARASKILPNVELARVQVEMASTLVLNKRDRLAMEEREPMLAIARQSNPHADCHWAEQGNPGREVLLKWLTTPAPTCQLCGDCGYQHEGQAHTETHEHHHAFALPESFCTVAVPLPDPISPCALEDILQSLPEGVIRAKGFARLPEGDWHVLHKVFESIDIYPYRNAAPSTGAILICIGSHLDARVIHELVQQHSAAIETIAPAHA